MRADKKSIIHCLNKIIFVRKEKRTASIREQSLKYVFDHSSIQMHILCVLYERFVSSKLKKNTALFVLVLVNVHLNGYEVNHCRVADCCTYILLLYRNTCTYFQSSVYENKLYIILTLKWIFIKQGGRRHHECTDRENEESNID